MGTSLLIHTIACGFASVSALHHSDLDICGVAQLFVHAEELTASLQLCQRTLASISSRSFGTPTVTAICRNLNSLS